MQNHRELRVWDRAHQLTLFVLRCTQKPSRGMAWLVGQLRHAAASISSNIAEGAGQETPAQFGRFLVIALSSSNEVANHAAVAHDIGILDSLAFQHIESEIEAIRALLTVLLRRIREREARSIESQRGVHS